MQYEKWKKCSNLEEYIFKNPSDDKIKVLVNGKLCKSSSYDYYKFRPTNLFNLLKEFTSKSEDIVELGCGYGVNLFSLITLGLKNQFEGYDISHNGILSANKINDYFDCGITFQELDITDNFQNSMLKNKCVFTYYVMEQVKYDTEKIIENILQQKPKQVLHIEPIFEMYEKSLRDKASKLYIKFQDYQNNLLTTLQKFEKEGRLKITDIRRLGYSRNPLHEASFVRWIPT